MIKMINLLFICRDALANTLINTLLLAIEAKKEGKEVAVCYTGEALLSVTKGVFRWSPQLSPQDIRLKLSNEAVKLNIPIMGSGVARQLDPKALIRRAIEAKVPMFACAPWVELLELEGSLPEGISKVDMPTILKWMESAKVVIGSF